MTRTLASILAATALLGGSAPRTLEAADCTTRYQYCLNDSWDLNTVLRSVADLYCFDQYISCVGKKLLFG